MKNRAVVLLILCFVFAGISTAFAERRMTKPSGTLKSRSKAPSDVQVKGGQLQLDFEKKSISYRAKHVVYAQIENTLKTEIIPILYKGRQAHRFLLQQKKDAVSAANYDKNKEKKMVDKIIYALFYDIILQLEKVIKAEKIEIPADVKQKFIISGFKQVYNTEKFSDKKIDLFYSDNEMAQKIFENNLFEPLSIMTGLVVKIALLLPQDLQADYDKVIQRYTVLINNGEIANVNERLFSDIPQYDRKCYFEPYAKRIYSTYQDFFVRTKKINLETSENKENKVLLKVNGKEVYGRDFDVSLRKHIRMIKQKKVSEEEKKRLIKKLRRVKIKEIVSAVRMEQEARKYGIDMSVEKMNAFYDAKAAKSFETAEEYKSGIMKRLEMSELDAEKYFKRMYIKECWADLNVKNLDPITEDFIDAFIQRSTSLKKKHVPEKVTLKYIEVSYITYPIPDDYKKEAEEISNIIHEKAKQGQDFYSIVKQHPQTSVYRVRKGLTPYFPESTFFPFKDVLSMGIGEVSDVISTQDKYFIFKTVDRVNSHDRTDSQIREKARQLIASYKRRNSLKQHMSRLSKTAKVEIIDKDLK